MLEGLKQQYEWIKATRQTLFSYLDSMPLEDLHKETPFVGSGSIIKTHIHVADCYRYWLGSFAFQQKRADFKFASEDEIKNADVGKVRQRFKWADETVGRFMGKYENRWLDEIANEVKWQTEPWSITPLWLLTHTQTHEFHHKGQIVSMTKYLGYNPPNTDLEE